MTRLICSSQYRRAAHYNITHLRRQSFHSLPVKHSSLLSEPPFSILSTLQAVDDAIDKNADISEAILAVGLDTYGIDPASSEWKGTATPNDMDKARSTIRQLYRVFSAEGRYVHTNHSSTGITHGRSRSCRSSQSQHSRSRRRAGPPDARSLCVWLHGGG